MRIPPVPETPLSALEQYLADEYPVRPTCECEGCQFNRADADQLRKLVRTVQREAAERGFREGAAWVVRGSTFSAESAQRFEQDLSKAWAASRLKAELEQS